MTGKPVMAIVFAGRYDPLLAPPSRNGERIALHQAFLCPANCQQCKRLTSNSPQQRQRLMRDFRDAKAMAQTLRNALKAKSVTLTNSESLELIAKIFGLHDWNVLSARIGVEPNRIPIRMPLPAVPLPAGADLPLVPLRDIVLFSEYDRSDLRRAREVDARVRLRAGGRSALLRRHAAPGG